MTETVIDEAVLIELKDEMGSEFVTELVTTFIDEVPGMMADLKNAVAQNDAEGFRRAAHSIKSNAQVFGANALAQIARDLELSGQAATPVQTTAAIAELDLELARASDALRSAFDG